MVMAKDVAFAGAFSQAKGMLFSMPLTFFSHLKASNKTPLAIAVLVNLNPVAETVGVVGVVVVVPVLVVAAGVTTVSLLQANINIENAKK
jgi:ACR3 family arsenite efflux pump ArsB